MNENDSMKLLDGPYYVQQVPTVNGISLVLIGIEGLPPLSSANFAPNWGLKSAYFENSETHHRIPLESESISVLILDSKEVQK